MTRAMSCILLIVCVNLSHGEDWPQWRGVNRDGKSNETGLLKTWPKEGPRLLWQVNDLGNGYSTPSAANGVVYLIANRDLQNEDLIALSLEDGTKLWSIRLGNVGKNEGPQYPGARSTPTIDGDSVYALGSDGDLLCVRAKSGDILWKKNLKVDFGGQPGMWAYTESPLIDAEQLICSPGGADATVVALNKSTGETIWKSALPEGDKASFSSPIMAEVDGTKQYILFLGNGAVGVDPASGQSLWRYTKTSDKQANVQTPVAENGLVYTAASRVGSGLIKVSRNAPVTEVYFGGSKPSGMGGCILIGRALFGSTGSTMACIDFATGKENWRTRSMGACSMCYADEKLYLHGEDNELVMIAASPKAYEELGRVTPPDAPDRGNSKAWAYPIIADGKLLVRDVGTVWCYDIKGE